MLTATQSRLFLYERGGIGMEERRKAMLQLYYSHNAVGPEAANRLRSHRTQHADSPHYAFQQLINARAEQFLSPRV